MNQLFMRKPQAQNGVTCVNAHDTNTHNIEPNFITDLIAQELSGNVILISLKFFGQYQ